MRIGLLSDVHGNAVALQAVLAEQMVEMLEKPATREELVEHGEKLEFAG